MAATEPPYYVFWYQQGHMINYDAEPGVKVELTKSGSILKVSKTKTIHGGNYTCVPSNAKPSSVMIHVIEGEIRILSFSFSTLFRPYYYTRGAFLSPSDGVP